eukprot:5142034-Prymnesium_polylepis.1
MNLLGARGSDTTSGWASGPATHGHAHPPRARCVSQVGHNSTLIAYALPSPPPGRSPWAPVPRFDVYGIGVDPSKRSAP